MVFDKHANLVKELPQFKEELDSIILNDDGTFDNTIIENNNKIPNEELVPLYFNEHLNIPQIHKALLLGIKDYFEKMGFSKAILGSFGTCMRSTWCRKCKSSFNAIAI